MRDINDNREAIRKALQDFCKAVEDMPVAKTEEEQKFLDHIWEEVDELNEFMTKMIKSITKK